LLIFVLVGDNQQQVINSPIQITQLLSQLNKIAPGQQFKKIQPVGGVEVVEPSGQVKTYPKLLKGKKGVTEIKIRGSKQLATTTIQMGDGSIVPIMNEFPNLITIHGLTKDKKDEQESTDGTEEPTEGISYSDLLCTEEMGKKSDDGQESTSKSPEPMEEDIQEAQKEETDNEPGSDNISDSVVLEKRGEDEKVKTFKPPTRIYKRPSILGTRKRIHPEQSDTQAMLKETLRAELLKLNEEEEKGEGKKKKKQPKEKKNNAKIVTKIDESLIKPAIEDFDPANLLEWRDGVGVLPGSNLKVIYTPQH